MTVEDLDKGWSRYTDAEQQDMRDELIAYLNRSPHRNEAQQLQADCNKNPRLIPISLGYQRRWNGPL